MAKIIFLSVCHKTLEIYKKFSWPLGQEKMPLFALWNGLKIVRTSLHIALCQLRQVLWISLHHQFVVPELHSVLSNV